MTEANIEASIKGAMAQVYDKREKPAVRVTQIVALALGLPKAIDLQVKYLNGESPNGNPVMDRGDFAKALRELARSELSMPIPADVKTAKLAKIIFSEMKRAGMPMQRNGHVDAAKLSIDLDDGTGK